MLNKNVSHFAKRHKSVLIITFLIPYQILIYIGMISRWLDKRVMLLKFDIISFI